MRCDGKMQLQTTWADCIFGKNGKMHLKWSWTSAAIALHKDYGQKLKTSTGYLNQSIANLKSINRTVNGKTARKPGLFRRLLTAFSWDVVEIWMPQAK